MQFLDDNVIIFVSKILNQKPLEWNSWQMVNLIIFGLV